MKRIITLVLLMHAFLVGAQNQILGFNYQAVARNNSGQLLVNQKVSFKFNFIQGSISNQPIYTETHDVVTDDLGQVNMVMGNGTPVLGAFDKIDWSKSPYFLGIEMNIGNGFNSMGITQFMSVPYAKYAETSGNTNGIPNGSTFGEMMFWDGKSWVTIAPGKVGEYLVMCDNGPKWGNCEIINPLLPSIKLTEVTFLNETEVNTGINIVNDGGSTITKSGICWRISNGSDLPTINDNVVLSSSNSIGLTTLKFTVKPGEYYVFRAFAENKDGIVYDGDFIEYKSPDPVLPTIKLSEVTFLNETEVNTGINIVNDGGIPIESSGICWRISNGNDLPTINDNVILSTTNTIGLKTLKFTIKSGDQINIRAFAKNKNGITYDGDYINYSVTPVFPILTTDLIAEFTGTTAVCYGNIKDDLGEAILESGVVWSESKSPTIDAGNKIKSTTLGVGAIVGKLTNLDVNKIYFVRTYAINKFGVAYGNEQFLDTTVPDVIELTETGDGNVYLNQKYLKPTKIIYKNLVNINGSFSMNNAENVISVEFPLLEKVNGYFYFAYNNNLVKISAPKLSSVNSSVSLYYNPKLENLEICNLKNIYCGGGEVPNVSIGANNVLFDAKPLCFNPVLEKPEIKLLSNVAVTNTTAICNFEIIKLCDSNPKIFWSTVSSANATSGTVIESMDIGKVNGSVTLYNLTPKTTYYARVGYENGGSVYGNEITFTTN